MDFLLRCSWSNQTLFCLQFDRVTGGTILWHNSSTLLYAINACCHSPHASSSACWKTKAIKKRAAWWKIRRERHVDALRFLMTSFDASVIKDCRDQHRRRENRMCCCCCCCPPKGGRGISDVSPLSRVSGLSVWSNFSIPPLLFFCLVLLLFLSDPFLLLGHSPDFFFPKPPFSEM